MKAAGLAARQASFEERRNAQREKLLEGQMQEMLQLEETHFDSPQVNLKIYVVMEIEERKRK